MRRLLLGLGTVLVVGVAVAWSGPKGPLPEFNFQSEARNPVSNLRLNNDPRDFQFVVVSDRTGGHRARVFSKAVEQINLLQPEFVVSVGDLIEGYTEDAKRLTREWREFQTYVSQLQMPFFYVPGNHDIANPAMDRLWKEKFGRRYYEFVYRDVLFLMLNSEDPPGKPQGQVSADQVAWLRKTLADNASVRWTLVFVHKPMWIMPTLATNGWLEVENLLKDRPYTVFAGHVHRYQKFVRNGRNYYMLATTGGDSKMRGVDYGEFDHVVWVTMKKEGPVLANILLDGILPEDLRLAETGEEGFPEYFHRPPQPVAMKVSFEGRPIPGALVTLQRVDKEPRQTRADGVVLADGSVPLSTYQANDGVPAGDYTVTVVWRKPFFEPSGKFGPNLLPERYATAKTSGLTVKVEVGANTVELDLKK